MDRLNEGSSYGEVGRRHAAIHIVPGGFELDSAGAFYGWVRHPFDAEPTQSVVERLVVDHAVVTIPGTAFTPVDDHHLRVSFGNLSDDQIRDLGARLAAMH